MPRRARLMLAGVPVHIIQRGNNRQDCFYQDIDRRNYLEWMGKYSEAYQCQVHAYCLMTNHVHLLVTGAERDGISLMMKHIGQKYTQYSNRRYDRTGTLWEGRYKSSLVWDQNYLFACYRYIEMNPVRAGMVDHPAEYRWSSYRVNAHGELSSLLTPHGDYIRLASRFEERLKNYQSLFRDQLSTGVLERIRQSTNGNYALGSEESVAELESILGRRAKRAKAGRPALRK